MNSRGNSSGGGRTAPRSEPMGLEPAPDNILLSIVLALVGMALLVAGLRRWGK